MESDGLSEALERAEGPLLGLAAVAVAAYLLDLADAWAALGLETAYLGAAHVIDLVFVVDLVLKGVARGRQYFRTPWFLIDLLCALPLLSTLSVAPSALQGLRFVRLFRMLRALRTLRALRSLRVLRLVAPSDTPTVEQRRYHRVLSWAVVTYAVGFVAAVALAQQGVDAATGREREMLLVLGSLAGMGLILTVVRYQVPALWSRQLRALLNVALPEQVADHFLANPDAYDRSVRAPATIIFCDLKGFTSTVEAIGIVELKQHLESALDAIVEAHLARDLIVDKFIGDAVMSFRGGDLVDGDPADHAYRVVRGGLDGIAALEDLGDPWFQELKVGGASAQSALIGTFGASRRLSYTVLGDRVNLAARLEASCNALGVRTLFCDRTHDLVGDRPDVAWRRVGVVRVQGKEESVACWEAFAPERTDLSWLATWDAGLAAWEQGEIASAAERFRDVLALRNDDGPSARYLASCEALLASGLPEGWSPVLITRK